MFSKFTDRRVDQKRLDEVQHPIEKDSLNRVTDLHVSSIGLGALVAEVAILSDGPKSNDTYRDKLAGPLNFRKIFESFAWVGVFYED